MSDIYIDTSYNYADLGLIQGRLIEFAANGVHAIIMRGKLGAEAIFGEEYPYYYSNFVELKEKINIIKEKIRPPPINMGHLETLKGAVGQSVRKEVRSKLKVLHIQEWNCSRNLKIACELKDHGIVSYLFCERSIDYDGESKEIYEKIFENSGFRDKVTFSQSLQNIVAEYGIDIIHCHNEPDVYTIWAKEVACAPVVHDEHTITSTRLEGVGKEKTIFLMGRRMRAESIIGIETTCMNFSDLVVVVNEQCYSYIHEQYAPDQIIIVGNWCPSSYVIDKSVERKIPEDELHVVNVGNIDTDSYRNIQEIIEILLDKEVHVHIYWKEDPYQFDSPFYHFEGYHGPRKLISLIGEYDYGLMAYEPNYDDKRCIELRSPGKLYDYLAAGLPTITFSSMGKIADFVKKKKIGVVFKDINTFKKGISKLYNRSFEIDISEFTLSSDIEVLIDAYNELVI